jgi:general secretion pathway protein G
MQKMKGFTLLELLVVMVIIGLLVGIVGPKYFSQLDQSKIKTARAQIDAFGKALDHYRLDNGRYPTTEEGLEALRTKPQSASRWRGPYLDKALPVDPWDKTYQYKSPGERGEYDLYSFGSDGQPGGNDNAADIGNWGS